MDSVILDLLEMIKYSDTISRNARVAPIKITNKDVNATLRDTARKNNSELANCDPIIKRKVEKRKKKKKNGK